jgi:hypothetical protein
MNSQLLFRPSYEVKVDSLFLNKYFLEIRDQISEEKSRFVTSMCLVFTAFDSGQYSLFGVLNIDFLRRKHFKETNFIIFFVVSLARVNTLCLLS